jgi:serine/threonine-protein kinase HipA
VKTLTVVYDGWGEHWPLGRLAHDGRTLLFEWSPQALREGLELSPLRVPLGAASYGEFPGHQQQLPGFIADALPDGWGISLMDRLFRKRGLAAANISPLDRLAFLGNGAMGALSFEPANVDRLPPEEVELLALAREMRDVMADTSEKALLHLALIGGSPQGTRPKALLNFDVIDGAMSTDENAPGEPWLVKFHAADEHKEASAIEALYANLARACGLDMPESRYFDIDGKLAAFGVRRFDREGGSRVPMHTLAGALHADFRMTSVDYTTLLRLTRRMTHDERDVARAYARCVFNVVFNNRDDHPKNISFRLDEQRLWHLSPAYDLTFCEGPGGEHQMDICGEGRAPTRRDLLRLAEEGGVDRFFAARVIEEIAGVAGEFAVRADAFPIRTATTKSLIRHIEANRRRLLA